VRSFFNLLVVLVVYFAGISANTGDKQTRKASQSDVGKIVLKDGRIVYKEAKFAQPLKAGKIPDVTVKDIDGKGLKLREMAAGRPMLLVFYRGGWCPFCNRQLAGLQEIKDQIADKGYQLVAVSADRPEKNSTVSERPKTDLWPLLRQHHGCLNRIWLGISGA
jgi:thiol-disulfide isomerase/thioredoxin